MQGDSAMASTVTTGGEVRMSTDTPTVVDGGTTRTGQWSIMDLGAYPGQKTEHRQPARPR